MTKLSSIELWKLADTLSVVNASILICGGDPSDFYWDDDGNRVQKTWQHEGFEAVLSALRSAILTNKLAANVTHALRSGRTGYSYDDQPYEVYVHGYEDRISYDLLIARHHRGGEYETKTLGQTVLNFSPDSLSSERYLYICKEPNWEQTTVEVEHLKDWLKLRGVFPDFFFPRGNTDQFRSSENPRYSAKLACAVAAWEAVTKPARNKSVKQTLQDWVQSNGVQYGVGENSVVSPTAAEEIAKISNWNTKGGATATSDGFDGNEQETEKKPVENYRFGYPENTEDDCGIPF